ncbi:helix-turn-helix domain-containing protein [Bacillus sp. S/N-304-OC-R1]|uniref:helix-turn-helix domain-containing protein n=1 Tax=Bacillus sp. S/N-304-OC-R1 TaxID=2758034 RepID=UPI001C8E66DB|nr:helix-turn-helix domain-containing protein [Bacillus sp. S/N-304-OC-R1]MBY0122309.1 helix-turn-helix transcriptional regulator [Bacillus sp. S/N-304-OC-R1]
MGKEVEIALYKLIESHNIKSIRELGRLADIRPAALNGLANQKRQSISIKHIKKIAEALDITDTNEIIKIIDTDEETED